MRAFVVLCLVAVVCADKLGYDYQPVSHSHNGLYFVPGGALGAPSNNLPSNAAPGYGGPSSLGGQGSLSLGGSGGNGLPSSGNQGGNGHPSNGGSQDSYGSPGHAGQPSSNESPSISEPEGELEKEYYTFSANDNDFNEPASNNQLASSVKQGLRVIFIKGPENKGLEDAALNLAKQAANQQTDIYVLNKQTDLSDLANKLNNIGKNSNNKPEVHFVKYRTPEDAANAQKAIQDQYDSLGGPSQSINGGIAPVLNFASQAPIAAPSVSAPGNSYLPSSVLRRLRFRY